MKSIRDLNAEAISQLQKGNVFEGIETMKRAIRVMRKELNANYSDNEVNMMELEDCELSLPLDSGEDKRSLECMSTTRDAWITAVAIPDDDGIMDVHNDLSNLFECYNCAFEIPAGYDSHQDDAMYLVVLLYNSGLMWQVAARREQNREKASMLATLACKSYGSALHIASSTWGMLEYNECRCVLLALATNLGAIYFEQRDHFRIKECLELALDIIECPDTPNWISEDDFEFFYVGLAAFCLSDKQPLTSSPAA